MSVFPDPPFMLAASESYLMHHADLYWSTDFYVTRDQIAIDKWRPLYQQFNSSITSVDNTGIAVSSIPLQTICVAVVS